MTVAGLGDAFGTAGATGLNNIIPPKQPAAPPDDAGSAGEQDPEHARQEEERIAVAAELARQAEIKRLSLETEAQVEQDQEEQEGDGDAIVTAADTFQVPIYLLPAAIEAAVKLRQRRRVQNATIVFDALDARRDELRQLINERLTSAQGRPANSLFPSRPSKSTRTAAAAQGRRRLWSIQATEAELRILDQLAEQSGATSRSELCSVAVEAHLLPRRRKTS
ncbi:hypothetical protein GCM10027589_04550 [Actinocorallia lasiicapitis]